MCRHVLPVTLSKSSHRARRSKQRESARVEEDKTKKYAHLDRMYQFHPVAVETCGTIGPKSRDFLRELGKRLRMVTGEPQSYAFLMQRISVAIQTGNATSVISSLPVNVIITSISFEL